MGLGNSIKKAAEEAAAFAKSTAADFAGDNEPVGNKPAPVIKKVSVIVFDPIVKSEGGKKLSEVMKWSDPDQLTQQFIADMKDVSYGYVTYQIVERIESDKFPVKLDGFAYKADDFVKFIRDGKGFHKPDEVDYHPILKEFNIIDKVNRGAIDEVWLFAFPYAGFYESIMAGPGAFWCNAPELKGTDTAKKRFIIMGFNYERGVGQMLENVGHRAESIMDHVYRFKKGPDNLWKQFTKHEKTDPGQAEVGTLHFAPNSAKDYDWGNKTKVKSRWHVWKNFPNLEGEPKEVVNDWGNGEIRSHHQWWFKLLPHITGTKDGISYNWWKYIVDPNEVI
jgi:hypothetical protein